MGGPRSIRKTNVWLDMRRCCVAGRPLMEREAVISGIEP